MAFRTSKYRNILANTYKRELCFIDLKVQQAGPDANLIASSNKKVAFGWSTGSGGTLAVVDLDKPGKYGQNVSQIFAHSSVCTDVQFSPHDDMLLATGGEDSTVKLWKIPEEEFSKQPLSEAMSVLSGHSRRIGSVRFHPTANMTVGTCADKDLWIWDALENKKHIELDHPDQVHSFGWSYDGSLLASTCKDKILRVWDPRAKTVVVEVECHDGTMKSTRVAWLRRDMQHIGTTGFTKYRDQQFRVWDARKIEDGKALHSLSVGSGSGVLMPFADVDTGLVALAGKGEGLIRIVETVEEKPFVYEVAQHSSDVAQVGVAVCPKTSCDVMASETMKLLKLTNNSIELIMIKVPRKSYTQFSEELFPRSAHIGAPAPMSASEWLDGKNCDPPLTSLEPKREDDEWNSFKAKEKEEGKAKKKKEEEMEDPGLSEAAEKARAIVRESHFRHIRGKVSKAEMCYTEIKMGNVSTEGTGIKVSPKFFAVPWKAGGGPVCVWPLDKPGRLPTNVPLLTGHSAAVTDFDFCPADDHMLATGSEDANLMLWKIPEGGLTEDIKEPVTTLKGHSRKISILSWHSHAQGVILSGSTDNSIKCWDVQNEQEACRFEFGDEYGEADQAPLSLDFAPDGGRIVAVCRDKIVRVLDPRQGESVLTGSDVAHTGAKGIRVLWVGKREQVLTTGISKSSERQLRLWDVRNLDTPIKSFDLDVSSGALLPFYDADTSVLFLGGKGDGQMRTFEINDDAPFIHKLNTFNPGSPLSGMVMFPKTTVNAGDVEIRKFLRVTAQNVIEPLSFTVPRTRAEFFQDDIFPPTFDHAASDLTCSEWVSGTNKEPPLKSLQPEGMIALSKAPQEEKRMSKYRLEEKEETKELSRDGVFDKFYEQMQKAKEGDKDEVIASNFNFVTPDVINATIEGVDEDEWSD